MQNANNIADRLSFLEIDEETRSVLREFTPIAEKILPDVLDKFYAHVAKWPDLVRLFGADRAKAEAAMAHAREAQRQHWLNLFSGRFDENYAASVRKVGLAHRKVGLSPRWYIGGYVFATNQIYGVVAHAYSSRLNPAAAQDKIAKMIRAINRATMLDMDLALSVFLEETENNFSKKIAQLADGFETSVKAIGEAVLASAKKMQASANEMSAGAKDTTLQSASVATATDQASANVQTVASAAEELSASSQEIGSQMARAAKIAQKAVAEASQANMTVDQLAEASQKIGDVVALIQTIAGQTNLLALNATIEAARAGEAGKGFAVVASEVKSLANQTAKATDDISTQIAGMQGATKSTVERIKSVAATIGEINNVSASTAAAVQQQTAAIGEISRNVQQAAQGTSEIATSITGVTKAASDSGSTAATVLNEANQLAEQADKLRAEVEKFLATLRAA